MKFSDNRDGAIAHLHDTIAVPVTVFWLDWFTRAVTLIVTGPEDAAMQVAIIVSVLPVGLKETLAGSETDHDGLINGGEGTKLKQPEEVSWLPEAVKLCWLFGGAAV